MAYTPRGTKAICDRCGFEFPLRELRKEWTGLMVCRADLDPRPAEFTPPNAKAEGVPMKNARPDNQSSGPNTTTRDDL